MDDLEWARYAQRVQEATAKASQAAQQAFWQTLIAETEAVLPQLEADLRREGLVYSTNNETLATARAALWSCWTSWVWTAKSERPEPQADAKACAPVAARILQEASDAGKRIGAKGRTPQEFMQEAEAASKERKKEPEPTAEHS